MNWLWTGTLGLGAAELAQLFVHFALLSLLAVGGAMATAPDMHRWIVGRQGWLDDAQFTGSIALAQAAPGPNVLFVAVIGFNVGGLAGAFAALGGSLLPSAALALAASRWGDQRREQRGLRAFTAGMAPLTIGLLLSTCWVLVEPLHAKPAMWLLLAMTVAFMQFTRRSPLWPIAVGALAGGLGWV